jgi:hypothetical protein
VSARVAFCEPADQGTAWALAVRVAGVAAVLCAVLALALQRFAGVGAAPLLMVSVAVALLVGLRLPAAAPAFLQAADPCDAELEQLLDDAS